MAPIVFSILALKRSLTINYVSYFMFSMPLLHASLRNPNLIFMSNLVACLWHIYENPFPHTSFTGRDQTSPVWLWEVIIWPCFVFSCSGNMRGLLYFLKFWSFCSLVIAIYWTCDLRWKVETTVKAWVFVWSMGQKVNVWIFLKSTWTSMLFPTF